MAALCPNEGSTAGYSYSYIRHPQPRTIVLIPLGLIQSWMNACHALASRAIADNVSHVGIDGLLILLRTRTCTMHHTRRGVVLISTRRGRTVTRISPKKQQKKNT